MGCLLALQITTGQRVVGIDQGCQLSEETLDVERKGKEDKGKEIKV